jgi:hypothetical protein
MCIWFMLILLLFWLRLHVRLYLIVPMLNWSWSNGLLLYRQHMMVNRQIILLRLLLLLLNWRMLRMLLMLNEVRRWWVVCYSSMMRLRGMGRERGRDLSV